MQSGDSIRFGASTAAEDEPDLDVVSLPLDYYRAFARASSARAAPASRRRRSRRCPSPQS